MMVLQWFFYGLAAYLLGSITFGRLIARRVGHIDITRQGSGNVGATNVSRALGIKWGIVTLILDVLKGFIPVIIVANYYGLQDGSINEAGIVAVGLCALLGHQFSVFHRFKGGKGVATALGMYLGISSVTCISCLSVLILFVLVVYKWGFISLGSIVSACAIPVFLALFGGSWIYIIGSIIVCGLVCYKHKENIQRLLKKEEPKWPNKRDQESKLRSLSNSSSE